MDNRSRGKAGKASGSSRGKPELAAGDYVFLAWLLWAPMSAYDIKKAMAVSISNFWTAAHSQVYQQAKRLLRDGYIREKEVPGSRNKRLLSLTRSGRAAVLHWLRQPARPPQLYAESLVKLFFARQAGDPGATVRMLAAERANCAERLEEYERMTSSLGAQEQMRYPAMTLDMGIRFNRMAISWIDDTIAKLREDQAGARRARPES